MEEYISYIQLAYEVLEKAKQPLTPKEIWVEAEISGLSNRVVSKSNKPWYSIRSALIKDLNGNTQSHFSVSDSDPEKYTLKKFNKKTEEISQHNCTNRKIYEENLHEILCAYVNEDDHFKCHVKTINHTHGPHNASGLDKWAHPDMVGIYQIGGLNPSTVTLQKELSEFPYRFFSFELKVDLKISNLRESFFQAVSNSSWANEGYLVTLNLFDDDNGSLETEMALLCNAFGIGIIQLNIKNILDSKIKYSCKPRETLDWLMINKLVDKNKDFKEFIDDVILLFKNERGGDRFDIPKDIEELQEKFKIFYD